MACSMGGASGRYSLMGVGDFGFQYALPREWVFHFGDRKRALMREHLVQSDAHRPYIGLRVRAVIFGKVFGGHIRIRACPARISVGGKDFGQSEVYEFYLPVAVYENVRGLDVAMNRLHLMRVVERIQHLGGDVRERFTGNPILPQHLLQILAAHVLHINDDFALDEQDD